MAAYRITRSYWDPLLKVRTALDRKERMWYNAIVQAEVTASHPAAQGQPWFLQRFFSGAGDVCPLYFFMPDNIEQGGSAINTNDLMINDEIRDREVRLIGANGEQLGIMPIKQAQMAAEEAQLDLVKIAPTAKPPVCKIMDYGKYRFEQSKREREIRKNQKVITIKEVRLSATIDEHDVEVKQKAAEKFLKDGDKVKVSIRFRGRQITHSEIGLDVMKDFAERCKEFAVVERRPLTEGRNMTMIIAPKE